MQFSIVHVASFWAAIHSSIKFGSENTNDLGQAQRDKTLQGIIAFHGQNWKIFELFRCRRHLLGKLKNLNPSLAAIPCTFQRASRPFWLEVELVFCLLTRFFHKALWTKEPREDVDRSPLPTPTKASFVSSNDHWSVNQGGGEGGEEGKETFFLSLSTYFHFLCSGFDFRLSRAETLATQPSRIGDVSPAKGPCHWGAKGYGCIRRLNQMLIWECLSSVL